MLSGITAEHAQRPLRIAAIAQLLETAVEGSAAVTRHGRRRLIQRHHLRRAVQHRLNVIGDQLMCLRAGVEMIGKQIGLAAVKTRHGGAAHS
ncbi:hypothetical protein D3C78_1272870 [compost metagenome]